MQKREVCSDKKKKPNKSKVNPHLMEYTLPGNDGTCFNVACVRVCLFLRARPDDMEAGL